MAGFVVCGPRKAQRACSNGHFTQQVSHDDPCIAHHLLIHLKPSAKVVSFACARDIRLAHGRGTDRGDSRGPGSM
jgi:hypothetical protein